MRYNPSVYFVCSEHVIEALPVVEVRSCLRRRVPRKTETGEDVPCWRIITDMFLTLECTKFVGHLFCCLFSLLIADWLQQGLEKDAERQVVPGS